MNKLLALIPARSGSKGIKNKNILKICGKPLIQYTIEPALKLKALGLVDSVIVSTDCSNIANISARLGAEVPFLRPKNISGDKAKSIDLIIHTINYFKKKNILFDAVLLLQPTSPLRDMITLKKAIELFKNNNTESLISCYREEYINELVMYNSCSDNILTPLNIDHNKGVRRQDHGELFIRNGAIYITKVDYIKKTKQIISDNPLLIEMKKSKSINLDSLEDLEILKKMLCESEF